MPNVIDVEACGTVRAVCQNCGSNDLTSEKFGSLKLFRCSKCGYGTPIPSALPRKAVVQGILPGLQPGKQTRVIPIAEEAVQAQVMAFLCRSGMEVLQTSIRYKFQQCPSCGEKHRPTGGTGTTPGIPDLLVRRPSWPRFLWLGMEIKGSSTPLSAAQKKLAADGCIVVVRSVEDSEYAVEQVDKYFR